MMYISHDPSPPLDTYIYDLFYMAGPPPYTRVKAFPMPATSQLLINFGPTVQVYESEQANIYATCAESCFIGLWSKYHIVEWPQKLEFFGVHFKPAGAYPFLQLPLSELHNQVVSLDALWGHQASQIREQLYDVSTMDGAFALLEGLLLARLCGAPNGQDVVQYAIGKIAHHHGALSVRALSDEIGISQNHLGTLFKRMVGISVKELTRIYRFANVLRQVDPTQMVDWTEIAHQSHFYDQSHFNRDFANFTGYSPSDYLHLRRRFHTENPQQSQNLGHMPID